MTRPELRLRPSTAGRLIGRISRATRRVLGLAGLVSATLVASVAVAQPQACATVTPSAMPTAPLPDDGRNYAAILDSAQRGQARDQYWIGRFHEVGVFVPVDPARAGAWFRQAAAQGDAAAALGVERLGALGRATPTDTLFKVVMQSGVMGDPEAMFRVATFFAHGYAVEPDPDAALVFYRRAARAGHEAAIQALAEQGVDISQFRARKVPGRQDAKLFALRQAAFGGNADALFRLARHEGQDGHALIVDDLVLAAAERGHAGARNLVARRAGAQPDTPDGAAQAMPAPSTDQAKTPCARDGLGAPAGAQRVENG